MINDTPKIYKGNHTLQCNVINDFKWMTLILIVYAIKPWRCVSFSQNLYIMEERIYKITGIFLHHLLRQLFFLNRWALFPPTDECYFCWWWRHKYKHVAFCFTYAAFPYHKMWPNRLNTRYVTTCISTCASLSHYDTWRIYNTLFHWFTHHDIINSLWQSRFPSF